MAQTAQININVNTKSAEGNINKLSSSINNAGKTSESLKGQLRTITQELQGLEPGSKRFDELASKAGKLRDQIRDTNAVINATAGSLTENLAGSFTKIAGVGVSAFQGVGGAMALFGTDAEQIQEMMGRLQGAMAFGQALKDFGGLKDTFTEIKAGLIGVLGKMGLFTTATIAGTTATAAQTTATGAQTVATEVQAAATGQATVAQLGLNASMLANPVFLVIAAITALVAALVIFSSETEKAESMSNRATSAYERNAEAASRAADELKRIQGNRLELMQLEGASEEALHKQRLKDIDENKKATKDKIDAENEAIKKQRDVWVQAGMEENKEAQKNAMKAIKNHKDKIKAFKTEIYQYNHDIKAENTKFDADEEAREEQKQQERLRKQKEYADKRKSIVDEVRKAEQDAADAKLSEEDREIVVAKRKWEKIIADAKKYNIDTTKLKEGLREELAAIDAKWDKIEADKIKENNEKYYEYLDSLEEDASVKRMMALDDEIAVLDEMLKNKTISLDNYNNLTKNATDNAEKDITQIIKTEEDERLEKIKAGNNLRISYMEDGVEKQIAVRNQQFEDEKISLKKSLDEKLISEDEYNDMLVIAAERTAEDISKITRDAQLKKAQEYADAIVGFYSQISDQISSIQQQRADSEKKRIDGLYSYEKEALENQLAEGIIAKEQYDNKITQLDQQKRQDDEALARKSFEQQKKLQIANAVIQGSQAVLAAYSSGLATPLIGPATGAVYAAIAAAFAGIQINAIRDQQFTAAGGGIVPGNGSGNVDSVPSLLAPGETVINAQSSQMYPELLNSINMAGGGISLKPDLPAVNKNGSETRVFGDDKVNQPIRAYVVETEITDSQKRIDRIKRSAEF